MGSFVKCFDVVSSVVDVATENFAPLWKVSTTNMVCLKQYCAAIDKLANEFGGISFETEVDEYKMTICVKMECAHLGASKPSDPCYELIKRAISFGFSQSEDGNLVVEFVFPSVWEKAV